MRRIKRGGTGRQRDTNCSVGRCTGCRPFLSARLGPYMPVGDRGACAADGAMATRISASAASDCCAGLWWHRFFVVTGHPSCCRRRVTLAAGEPFSVLRLGMRTIAATAFRIPSDGGKPRLSTPLAGSPRRIWLRLLPGASAGDQSRLDQAVESATLLARE